MRTPLLACVLLLGGCFSSSSPSPSAPAGSETAQSAAPAAPDYSATIADPLGFLPRDSEIVVSLDAAQVRQSALWKIFEPRLLSAAGAGLASFHKMCGFDPLQSLRGLSMGIRGQEPELEAVFVVSGFDRTQIMDCVARDSSKEATVDGAFVMVMAGEAHDSVVFTFVDASTLVLSYGKGATKESLQAVLAAGSPLRSSPAFVDMFAQLDARASFWMVINGRFLDDAASFGVKMQALFGSVQLHDGIDAAVRMRLESAGQASQLSTMMQGQLGAAQSFVDKIEISADGADLVVHAAMNVQQLEMLSKMVSGF